MFPSFLISLLVAVIVISLIFWVLSQFPVDPIIAKVVRVLLVVIFCLWLVSALFGFGTFSFGHYAGPCR